MNSPWYVPPESAAPDFAPDRLRQHLETALQDLKHPLDPLPLAPIVLRREAYDDVFRGATALLGLLRRALLEQGPDMDTRAAALGIDPAVHYPLDVPGELEDRYATCMSRPDVVLSETGPKFVEFNIGGGLGLVVEAAIALGVWRSLYDADERSLLTSPDPMAVRDAFFARTARELGLPPAVVLVGSRRAVPAATSRHFDLQVDSMRRHGLASEFVEPEELPAVATGADPYRLGLRYFTVAHWTELGIALDPIRESLDAGCLLLATQTSYAIANKKVMAWVSEGRPWMSDADRETVARYLPWTRIVRDEKVEWEGGRHAMPDLLVRRQERFVLKSEMSWRAQGVTIGRDTAPADWAALVATAVEAGDHIAQELVEPVPHRLGFTGRSGSTFTDDIHPVFSPFIFDGRPGGMCLRYLPPGNAPGVVGSTTVNSLLSVALTTRS